MVEFDKTLDFDSETKKNISLWLEGDYDSATKAQIERLLRDDPQEAIDSFYTHLEFGTAGLRGIMGVGTNRMNRYTVGAATQGLANYLKKQPEKNPSVFISYDSRNNSRYFAEESAKVLAGNGIKVFLTTDIRPTPLVSFGCRFYHCSAAIMITASHNPKEYNGYKVYWNDGGQVLPPHDTGIITEAKKITSNSMIMATTMQDDLIIEIGKKLDMAYVGAIVPLQNYPEQNKLHGKELKIVYTSLHGTGITLIREALSSWGFTNVSFVEKQIIPDGEFPTVASPNPEERAALALGIEQMEKEKADIVIATDPDADRVGIAVAHDGHTFLPNGNQIAALLMEHICESGNLPENGAFIKSVVTTELLQAIADYYKRPLFNVLTGFKYIAELIRKWENAPSGYQFIFGGEESYGYLLGSQVRDKDAILTSCLIAEAALNAKLKNKTLFDSLHDIFKKYGVYIEKVLPLKFEDSKKSKELMQQGMNALRISPPKEIGGIPVASIEDYLTHTPKSDILTFWLKDGSKLMVRPSGTEPKVKIYCGVRDQNPGSIETKEARADKLADTLLNSVRTRFTQENPNGPLR